MRTNPPSGRDEKISRVAFHIRAVTWPERSETNALMKCLPVVVGENCLPEMTYTSSIRSPAAQSQRYIRRIAPPLYETARTGASNAGRRDSALPRPPARD